MKKPQIVLVDDHKVFREGLKTLIINEEIGDIIAEASNGKEFIDDIASKYEPDLVLMDITMPLMNGVEATQKALELNPDLKVLALSMHGDEEYYYKMIEAGVRGFILKDSGIKEIELAISEILDGESYFSNELLRRIIKTIGVKKVNKSQDTNKEELSKREIEILDQICKGNTNEEIGELLHISPQTVKGHRSNILSKTGCKNSASLVMYAIKHKLIAIN